MAKKTSLIKWALVFLVILFVLLIVVLSSLIPKEKHHAKVDYLAEYNKISKPADFNPNENAAPYFDKAFEVMAEDANGEKKYVKLWPADMNDDQLRAVRQWLESNRQTLDYLKQAASKPYYWKLCRVNDNEPLMMADMNDLALFRKGMYLLCMEAKLMAFEGQTEAAFNQLADVYKTGTFFAGPMFLIQQLVGIAISAFAVQSAFQVLEHTSPSPAILEDFQRRITSLSSGQPFLTDFSAEKLILYDHIEKFLGGGRTSNEKSGLRIRDAILTIFRHPWMIREKHRAERLFDYLDATKFKTPWQLHNEGNDVHRVTDKMIKGTLFVRLLAPAFDRVLFISYRIQVQTDALIAVTTILRYKADKGGYPQNLEELVKAGYLDKLPADPFSGGALVYKPTGDNFILYSFAADFNDDGGKHSSDWAEKEGGDFVFWPVQQTKTSD